LGDGVGENDLARGYSGDDACLGDRRDDCRP